MGLITHKMLLLYAYRHWNFQLRIERDVISDIQAILNRDDNENTRDELKKEAEAMAERLEAELLKRGALTIDMTCEIKNTLAAGATCAQRVSDDKRDLLCVSSRPSKNVGNQRMESTTRLAHL